MNKLWAKYKLCGLFTFAHTLCHARTLSHTRQTHIHAHVCMCILSFHNAAKSILIGDYLYYYYYCNTKLVLLTVCRLIRKYILHYIRQRWFDSIFSVRFHTTFLARFFPFLFTFSRSDEPRKFQTDENMWRARLAAHIFLLFTPSSDSSQACLRCSAALLAALFAAPANEKESKGERTPCGRATWSSCSGRTHAWAFFTSFTVAERTCAWRSFPDQAQRVPERASKSFRLTHSGLCGALQLFVRALRLWSKRVPSGSNEEGIVTNTRLGPGVLVPN